MLAVLMLWHYGGQISHKMGETLFGIDWSILNLGQSPCKKLYATGLGVYL